MNLSPTAGISRCHSGAERPRKSKRTVFAFSVRRIARIPIQPHGSYTSAGAGTEPAEVQQQFDAYQAGTMTDSMQLREDTGTAQREPEVAPVTTQFAKNKCETRDRWRYVTACDGEGAHGGQHANRFKMLQEQQSLTL